MKRQLMDEQMTKHPYIVDRKMTVEQAEQFMSEHNIRHLPVIENGGLVGLVDNSVLKLAKSFSGPGSLLVEDVMDSKPFCVRAGAPLGSVVKAMSENKYACAVVINEDEKIVGIFTVVDALKILGQMLAKHSDASEIPYDSFPQYMSW